MKRNSRAKTQSTGHIPETRPPESEHPNLPDVFWRSIQRDAEKSLSVRAAAAIRFIQQLSKQEQLQVSNWLSAHGCHPLMRALDRDQKQTPASKPLNLHIMSKKDISTLANIAGRALASLSDMSREFTRSMKPRGSLGKPHQRKRVRELLYEGKSPPEIAKILKREGEDAPNIAAIERMISRGFAPTKREKLLEDIEAKRAMAEKCWDTIKSLADTLIRLGLADGIEIKEGIQIRPSRIDGDKSYVAYQCD